VHHHAFRNLSSDSVRISLETAERALYRSARESRIRGAFVRRDAAADCRLEGNADFLEYDNQPALTFVSESVAVLAPRLDSRDPLNADNSACGAATREIDVEFNFDRRDHFAPRARQNGMNFI